MGSNREKSNIAIAILEKLPFLKVTKIISHFGGSNSIFADFTTTHLIQLLKPENFWAKQVCSFGGDVFNIFK